MTLLLNILWFVLGGFFVGLAWVLAGILMAITIIGLPWARSAFMLANFTFAPFGREVVSRRDLTGRDDLGTGTLGVIGNVMWFLLCGWWLAVSHIVAAAALGVTIIGIPFAVQHVKLAIASLAPVGMTVVPYDRGSAARQVPRVMPASR
ncbi:YccF domain-containing protein [soil metagenome]